MNAIAEFAAHLAACPLIAIIRGVEPEAAEAIGGALVDAGIRIIEVPLNSPRPFDSIARLARRFGHEALIGGGTVLDPANVVRLADAGGRIVVSGIPGAGSDLTPLWFRELELVGAYTATADDFATAIQAAGNLPHLEQLVGATYPLAGWRDAIDHAMSAGALGTFKVAFRPQD